MLVVGFDLDMTLLDSRPGIHRSMRALSAETGVFIDADLVVTRLGPKLEDELAEWFARADVAAMAERYRAYYVDDCMGDGTRCLPGAVESVDAVRAHGGRVLAVTGKSQRMAHRCLDNVGLVVDEVVGDVHGDEKRDALRARGATCYVGDTIADIRAAVDAEVIAVGVATGMHDRAQLAAAGASVVVDSLDEFPSWLARLARA
jgi:phosphoglycolate phosphatase